MNKPILSLTLALILLLTMAGCSAKSNAPPNPDQTPSTQTDTPILTGSTPLSWLLQAVPANQVSSVLYSDIQTLSAYQN